MSEKSAPANRALSGPFDSSEVDLPAGYLDFGAIRLSPQPEVGLRLEVEEATGRVVALTLERDGSVLQVSVFAASKHEGIWLDVIGQLSSSITASGGVVTESQTSLGLGITASVLQADGTFKPMKFIGADGPRWFIRGSVTGNATNDDDAMTEIEDLFRSLVIHRGDAPMPPKEPLEIIVPAGIITPPRPGI